MVPKANHMWVSIYNSDPESAKFAKEIEDYFEKKGFVIGVKPTSQIHGNYPKDKIGKQEVSATPDGTSFNIIIYPLY